MRRKRFITVLTLLLTTLSIALCLMGCAKANRYKVDLCGSDFCYEGVKSSYRAGEEVTVYFTLIATDTNYYFYLDDEPIDVDYDNEKGFIIRFTMPDHDVKLDYRFLNSMTESFYARQRCSCETDIIPLRAGNAALCPV